MPHTLYTLGRDIYLSVIELLARVWRPRGRYSGQPLTRHYKNQFYDEKTDLYEFHPQPPKWLWKQMHRTTLLTAYRDEDVLRERLKSADELLARIEEHVSAGQLYDIGANGGAVLHAAKKRGWSVDGNELSIKAIRWAKNHFGLSITRDYFTHISLDPESLSAVLMANVLEHTHDPKAVLEHAYKALEPGGVLYVYVPVKTKEELKDMYEPFHLFEFQKTSLHQLLDSTGFETLWEEPGDDEDSQTIKVLAQKPHK